MEIGKLTIVLSSRLSSRKDLRFPMASGTLARLLCDKSSRSKVPLHPPDFKMERGILEKKLRDNSKVLSPFGRLSGSGRAVGRSGCGRPRRLLLAERVLSLESLATADSVPGASWLSSTFNDLRSFNVASLSLSVRSSFLDKSSVVSLEIL